MRFALLSVLSILTLSADDGDVQAYVPNLTPLKRITGVLPDEARSQGIQGMVRLLLTIDRLGLVTNIEALSGPEILRKPAIDASRQWQFRPVIRNGNAVAAYTDEIVAFSIPGKRPSLISNMAEEMAATERILEIRKRFPRSKDQVLADLEQDSNGLDGPERYSALTHLAKAAWEAGANGKATNYAGELLSQVGQNKARWNDGNAIHDGNMVLGLVSLHTGNLTQAGKYLLEAGKTPGSPQLNSFGPNMSLAKELIQKGERDTVLEYFSLCRGFWKMGANKLDQWTATVRGGGTPDFGGNLMF